MGLKEEIQAAEGDVNHCRVMLEKAERHRDALYVQQAFERYGVMVGSIVRELGAVGRPGRIGIVHEVIPWPGMAGRPRVRVYRYNANNRPGRQLFSFYNWEVIKQEERVNANV